MDDETPRPKRGRPATGHDPVRTVRIGPIWDEARDTAKRRGDSMADIITTALTKYVARSKTDPTGRPK